MFVDFNILNQLGSPSINSNTFANRPAAGQTGRLFVSIDTFEIYRDNGTTWDLIGGPGSSTVTGTGSATQVAYWTAAQAIGGSNNLWWDNTSGFLGVASNAPTARIEAVKTDGIGIYANYTTNAGSGSSATAIWAKNVTNSSGYGAVIEETTPNATAGQYPLLIKHSLSSGTAGVGMGTGVHWQLPDDAGTFKTTQLTVETIDAAAATYKTRYRFNVQNNGSSLPVAYINSTGLGIFTATPSAALDIHSTGTIAQLNSTGTTNNGYLAFQRTGATTFSIGDTYNGGSNYFRIFGSALSADIVRIFAATGESSFTSTETYSSGNSIGVAVQHNLTIPNGVNVGLAALGGVNSNLNLSLGGSTTVANTGRQGLEGSTTINFTGAGTLTMTQGTTVRAFSALSSVYAFNGSAVGTITHLAGLRICFPDNVGSAVNITNNYALLINNQTTGTGTVTYTNRWGIYQEGSLDTNYLNGTTLIGTTVNAGYKLDVSGSANATTLYENGVRVTTTSNISGTTNYLAKFTSANVVGNSIIFESSGNINLSGNTAIQLNSIPATTSQQLQFQNTGTNKWQLYLDTASNAFNIFNSTNSTNAVTVDTSGNLGLGVTPSAWSVVGPVIEFTAGGFIASQGSVNTIYMGSNHFYNGTNFIYKQNGFATQYQVGSGLGNHQWYVSASGTAGNAISFTQAMTLDASGNLGINNNTPASSLFGKGIAINGGSGLDTQIRLQNNNTGTGTADGGLISLASDNSIYFYNYENSDLVLGTNNQIRATVKAGGNFLIGTTTDAGYKLDINGTTRTGNIYMSTNSSRIFSGSVDFAINDSLNTVNILHLNNSTFAATFASSITTGAPSGGTAAAWKFGSRVAATVALDTTQYIELDVGGTLYKLAIVT